MAPALWAGFWGLVGGSALVLGAAIAWVAAVPPRLVAAVMAFGSGVLISALSFDLMDAAFRSGGFDCHRGRLPRRRGGLYRCEHRHQPPRRA